MTSDGSDLPRVATQEYDTSEIRKEKITMDSVSVLFERKSE